MKKLKYRIIIALFVVAFAIGSLTYSAFATYGVANNLTTKGNILNQPTATSTAGSINVPPFPAVQRYNQTGDVTATLISLFTGESLSHIYGCQAASGGPYAWIWSNTGIYWLSGGPLAHTTTPGACDDYSFYYDGVTIFGYLVPNMFYATPTPTATPTQTQTPTPTATLTQTQTPTPTPTPATVVVFLTSGTSWTVPVGVTSVKCEAIGGGGNGASVPGGGGGQGGGYAKQTGISVTPLSNITYQIGIAGGSPQTTGATYFNGSSLAGSSCGAAGGNSATTTTGASGAQVPYGIGSTLNGGGLGGTGISGDLSGGGGGGAAGLTFNGVSGNGGNASTSGAGGAGDGGNGGAGGGAVGSGTPGVAGSNGTEYSSSPAYGSGGGGGGTFGSGSFNGGAGGTYGSGAGGAGDLGTGGAGSSGLLILTYTP